MPVQQLSEASIYYEVTDFSPSWQPKNSVLLFIHGLNSSHEHWFQQVPVFSRNRLVITVDLRGHGASIGPSKGYSVRHHATDMIELLDKLELREVILVGASLGGCIAQQIAVRIPERIKAIVPVGSCAELPKDLNPSDMLPAIEKMGLRNFLTEMLPAITFSSDVDPGLVAFTLRIALANPDEIIMTRTMEGLAYDGRADARKITCPTLIVAGENDKTTPRYCSETMRDIISGSSLAIVPACGHLPHLEAPELFNEILKRFLQHEDSLR